MYTGEKQTLPPLNNAQITKLKHLTLVSLAMERRVSTIIGRNLHSLKAYLRAGSSLRNASHLLANANDT